MTACSCCAGATTPRVDRPYVHGLRTGWARALDAVADRLRAVQRRHGPDSVAVLTGGRMTNEKAYALAKLATHALGTRHVDQVGRQAAAVAGTRAFGVDRGLPFPLSDLRRADLVLLVGADRTPPVLEQVAGERLIVADPEETGTAARARVHLRLRPGTGPALANGLLHLLTAAGAIDRRYLDTRTTGYDRVAATVAGYWPERVERITGVPAEDLHWAAGLLADAGPTVILAGVGGGPAAAVSAWINLALALGLPGRPGSGFGALDGGGPAAAWGPRGRPGLAAGELIERIGERRGPRALLLFDTGPLDRRHDVDLLVVADSVWSPSAGLADVVLPAARWAEEEGTATTPDGRLLRRRAAHPPPPGVHTGLEIVAALAAALGNGEGFSADPERTFDELRRASAGGPADIAGVTYARLDAGEAPHWPCPSATHPGTPRLYGHRFPTPDGRARLLPVEQR